MTGFNNVNQMEDPDYSGYFVGTVKFNNDPLQRQRIKVEIPRLLEGAVENLPWVSPIIHSPFGITSGAGVVAVPALGALVLVEFQRGDIYYGLSNGSIHTEGYTPDAALLLNYPKRRGWSDPLGNLFWIDNTTGSVEVHFKHSSGMYLHINNAGEVTLNNTTKVTVNTAVAEVNATASATVTTPVATVAASASVGITSPQTTITGDLTVVGNVALSGGTLTHNTKNVGNTHTHSGVIVGGANTGAPT